ncbi:MAG: hypothetical protein MJZ41_12735 [Bacteroidaceae bacterium]|nr:hypothetical protein [Bacteroidaceae bacterium]
MDNRSYSTNRFAKVRIELSLEACEYLGGITNGVTIWNIYSELLNQLSQTHGNLVKRGILIELSPWEIDCSVNSLRQKFGIGPKPMTKVVNRFVELGIIRITPSKLASIADMVSVVGWTDEDGYHEIERNWAKQNPVVEDNKSDKVLDKSLPFNQSQEETKDSDIGEPKHVVDSSDGNDEENHFDYDENVHTGTGELQQFDKQPTEDSPKSSGLLVESHIVQNSNTPYNIDAHEVPDIIDSGEMHSPDESGEPNADGKPLSMTDIVSQMTGATNDFIIPAVISVPQIKAKPHGKHCKDNRSG